MTLRPGELDVLLTARALRGGADLTVVTGSIHGVEPGAFLVANIVAGLLALGVDPVMASRLVAGSFGLLVPLAAAATAWALADQRRGVAGTLAAAALVALPQLHDLSFSVTGASHQGLPLFVVGTLLLSSTRTRWAMFGAGLVGVATTFSVAVEVFAVIAVAWAMTSPRRASGRVGILVALAAPWLAVAMLPSGAELIAEKAAGFSDFLSTRTGWAQRPHTIGSELSVEAVVVAGLLLGAGIVALRAEGSVRRLGWIAVLLVPAPFFQDGAALPYLVPSLAFAAVALGVLASGVEVRRWAPLGVVCLMLAGGAATAPGPAEDGQDLWVSVGTHRFIERFAGGDVRGHGGFAAVVGHLDLEASEAHSLGFGYGLLVGSTWVNNDAPDPDRWHIRHLADACRGACREGWVRGVGCGLSGLGMPPDRPWQPLARGLSPDEVLRLDDARSQCASDLPLGFPELDLGGRTAKELAGNRWRGP